MQEQLGTIVSSIDGPSPSTISFVVNEGKAHKGMFVELNYSEGVMVCLVEDVIKTNRYFERPDSVKAIGDEMDKNFPISDWEFLLAKAKPLGVFSPNLPIQRATFPPSPGTKVFKATNDNVKKFLGLQEDGLMLGSINFHDVLMKVNLSKLLQKHLAILAMSGAGKCLSYDSKIRLSDGSFCEIGTLFDLNSSEKNFTIDGVDYLVPKNELKVLSLGENNKVLSSSVNFITRRSSPKNILELKTCSGSKVILTPEHLVPVKRRLIEWIPVSEIKEDDFLLLPRFSHKGSKQILDFSKIVSSNEVVCEERIFLKNKNSKTQISLPNEINVGVDFAKLLGYLLAEGHNYGKGLSFSNYDSGIQDDFATVLEKVVGIKPNKIKRFGEVRVYKKLLAQLFSRIGFTNSSFTKFVSQEILRSEEDVFFAFFSTLIDCDGHISYKNIELTLASENIIDSVKAALLGFGVVSHKASKIVKGKIYFRLTISGAKNAKILQKKLFLLLNYKRDALEKLASNKYNPNIDVVPNVNDDLVLLLDRLRLSTSNVNCLNYSCDRNNPSVESLFRIVNCCEKRLTELDSKFSEVFDLFFSMPNIFENEVLEIIRVAHPQIEFKQMVLGSNTSATTARRIVRGITFPTQVVYSLAQNCLTLQGGKDFGLETISKMDFSVIANKVRIFCDELKIEQKDLLQKSGVYSTALYEWSVSKKPQYSDLYSVVKSLYLETLKIKNNLVGAKEKINFLKSLCESGLFFDKVKSITQVSSPSKYIYDLAVDSQNFFADNLVVHNSYCVSVLLEELLSRSKEQGEISVIVFDTHGEYTCFGEPAKDPYKDFSSKTRIIDATKIRIACSKLTSGMLAHIMPELSSPQKRELASIISRLSEEMKNGVGPFDLNAIKAELSNSSNQKTAETLLGVLAELEDLNLFSKIDSPSVEDLAKPGQLTVIDLNNVLGEKKKQIIVSYFSSRLFNDRRHKKIPPFALFVEEAHNFIPETTSKDLAIAKPTLRTIAREGRKFGAALVVISQRPKRLDTTTLANCNTNIILRITNPYDLDHIKQSSEGLDVGSINMISSLRVGEALIVGEAVGAPTFFKVRLRTSQPSKHETTLEEAAKRFSLDSQKKNEEAESFL